MQVHQRPLILLTRPRAASERFAETIKGADVVITPLMEIAATGEDTSFGDAKAVILTSQNAVSFAHSGPLPAYCVGPRTAQEAREAGFDVRLIAPDAEHLIAALQQASPPTPLLHIHGIHQRGDVVERLTAMGLPTRSVAAYDQRAQAPSRAFHEALEHPHLIVPLFSPRSAKLFAQAADRIPDSARIVALSQAVADALPEAWKIQCQIAAAPNAREMGIALQAYGVEAE